MTFNLKQLFTFRNVIIINNIICDDCVANVIQLIGQALQTESVIERTGDFLAKEILSIPDRL